MDSKLQLLYYGFLFGIRFYDLAIHNLDCIIHNLREANNK